MIGSTAAETGSVHGREDMAGCAANVALPFSAPARLIACGFLLIGITALIVNLVHPYRMDFVGYWAAATLADGGHPALAYDLAAHHAAQQTVAKFATPLPFPYPPPYMLVLMPFGLLPYAVAAGLWLAVTGGAYLAVMRRLFPGSRWHAVAFPPVLVTIILGQNAFMMAALLARGALLLPRRPFIAGVIFGLLVIKPHLGVLLPLAFIAGREWRAFAGAACGALGALIAALVAFGPAPYAALYRMAPLYGRIMRDGLVPWHKMASLYATLSALGVSPALALALHLAVAAAAAAAVWRVWRSDADSGAKCAVLAAATLLISPYLYIYDMVILTIPLLWLLEKGVRPAVLAAAWALMLVSLLQDWGLYDRIDLLPFVSLGVLFLVLRELATATALAKDCRTQKQALAMAQAA